MKQVVAIVKPFLAEKIIDGLRRAPLEAIEVTEVKGMGRQKSYLDQYTDSEYAEAFLPKVQITAWVDDSRAEEVIRKIVEMARTGRMGDGKILAVLLEGSRQVGRPFSKESYSLSRESRIGRKAVQPNTASYDGFVNSM